MIHNEAKVNGAGGKKLYYQSWHPDQEAKAVLVLVHGLGEHSSRYSNLINGLVPQGFAVYTFDHRGHGKSAEKLCAHVIDWSEYLKDVAAFVKLARRKEPDLPLFLMGHSMGGLIALGYAEAHPEGVNGVVASAPAVGKVGASPVLLFVGRIMSRIAPSFSLDSGLDVNAISRDPVVVKAYQDDPLVHGKVSARFSTEFMAAIDRTREGAATFRPPLLIVHGEADTLVAEEGSRLFLEKVPHDDKKRIVYEGGFHEPHNDLQHEQVVADIHDWLVQHL